MCFPLSSSLAAVTTCSSAIQFCCILELHPSTPIRDWCSFSSVTYIWYISSLYHSFSIMLLTHPSSDDLPVPSLSWDSLAILTHSTLSTSINDSAYHSPQSLLCLLSSFLLPKSYSGPREPPLHPPSLALLLSPFKSVPPPPVQTSVTPHHPAPFPPMVAVKASRPLPSSGSSSAFSWVPHSSQQAFEGGK